MKKILTAALAAILVFSMTACNSSNSDSEATTTTNPSVSENTTETTEPAKELTEVKIAVLSGSTGIGASKLMNDSEAGITEGKYTFTVETENSNVTAGLTAGDYDIAMTATNVAANLYNKSGDVQIAALSALGVLSVISCGTDATAPVEINSVADLSGKTIYTMGKGANPEYVLNYVLAANGVTDANIEFASADEVITKMVSEGGICMLPQPAASTLMIKNKNSVECLSLSEEWDKLNNGSRLAMSCVVVNKEFAEKNPETVAVFLKEYAASIDFVNGNPDEAAKMIVAQGIVGNENVAKASIPKCHLVFISGSDIKDTIYNYYQVLFDANPASIGGNMPDDGIYYVATNS